LIDLDAWEAKAAFMEYMSGLSRFEAETLAASQQGAKRWEVMDAIKRRNSEEARDRGQAIQRLASGDVP
jgi:hypothetical protein